jgi:hypothetical protein
MNEQQANGPFSSAAEAFFESANSYSPAKNLQTSK